MTTALDGMRILDLTQYEAGPSATQALAFMGADVVKVERPRVGDPGRFGAGKTDSGYFLNWNANKRSVALDLASDEGRALLLDLVPRFDVMVENFGPGAIEKLRLGYDDVRVVHPSIIFAQVKGFGSFGPYSGYKCFDGVAQAASGAFSLNGMPDDGPLPLGATLGDVGTGMQLARTNRRCCCARWKKNAFFHDFGCNSRCRFVPRISRSNEPARASTSNWPCRKP